MRWRSILATTVLIGGALTAVTPPSEAATNVCSNPVLATNLNGWGALDSGTVSRVAVTGASGASYAFATTGKTFFMPQLTVAAGQMWTLSAQDWLVAGTGTSKLTIEWYSSSGAYLSESAGASAALDSTAWTPVTATVTAPSGAVNAHILQEATTGSSTSLRSTLANYGQVTTTTAPTVPTNVKATVSGSSATLTWAAPTSNGGSAITGYTYGRDGTDSQGTGPWSGTGSATTWSATFNLLKPGTTYHLTVASKNAIGTGPTATAAVTIPAAGGPSGQAMPVGNLTGWRQVFTEDFTKNVALGSWPGAYSPKWGDYTWAPPDFPNGVPDTKHGAIWRSDKDVSVSGGLADYYLHSENGQAYAAALLPQTAAQTYGRYEVRFKVDPGMAGWKSAWLLWPDDGVWPDHGEIDFPEGDLTGTIGGFMHYAVPWEQQEQVETDTASASGWHTATTEWLPGSVKYSLDGTLIGTFTNHVSSYPMHWVLQSESASAAHPTGSGHIKIDWAVIYARS